MNGTANLIRLRNDFDNVPEEELQNSFRLLVEFYKDLTNKGMTFLDPNSTAVVKSSIFLCLRLYTDVCKDRFGYDLSEQLEDNK